MSLCCKPNLNPTTCPMTCFWSSFNHWGSLYPRSRCQCTDYRAAFIIYAGGLDASYFLGLSNWKKWLWSDSCPWKRRSWGVFCWYFGSLIDIQTRVSCLFNTRLLWTVLSALISFRFIFQYFWKGCSGFFLMCFAGSHLSVIIDACCDDIKLLSVLLDVN